MKEKLIPVIFSRLLNIYGRISTYDIDDYEELSVEETQQNIFAGLGDNPLQTFDGAASRIHESSHREVFHLVRIHCNYLHLAIQLQRLDLIIFLLEEGYLNPFSELTGTHSIDKEEYDVESPRKESSESSFSVTPLWLAQQTGNEEIVQYIKSAITEQDDRKLGNKQEEVKDSSSATVSEKKAAIPPKKIASTSNKKALKLDDGYEPDVEEEKVLTTPKKKHYKKRLMLGDGNLSYSRALLKKRQEEGDYDFSGAMTVTELNTEEDLEEIYQGSNSSSPLAFKNFKNNVEFLREMGAEVTLGVDATTLHDEFAGERFKRIHFNFPYYNDPGLSPAENKSKTKEVVGQFFQSATQVQQPGDRIHMALVTGFKDNVWYESATYGVAEFCEANGYAYIQKRNFIDPEKGSRYPGYFHVKTNSGANSVNTAETGREFIFEKKIPGKDYAGSSQKKKTRDKVERPVLIHRDTDSGSSSYVDHSDSDFSGNYAQLFPTTNPPGSAIKAAAKSSSSNGSSILSKTGPG